MQLKHKFLMGLTGVMLAGAASSVLAQASFNDVRKARSNGAATSAPALTPVREAVLREAAMNLGAQWGLGDRSRELMGVMQNASSKLDQRYAFGALLMGVGYLPPVISEARDNVAIDGTTMRVAKAIYVIDEPPRPVRVTPTWRDWLYVGLDSELRPQIPEQDIVLPRDAQEVAYWDAQLKLAYEEGRAQADQVFDLNMARLQRTYMGMRRYYDLFKRGMVTAPQIVSASSVINKTDPNTLIVGDMVFSVVVDATFNENGSQWVPLAK